jgi:hypothetical protein
MRALAAARPRPSAEPVMKIRDMGSEATSFQAGLGPEDDLAMGCDGVRAG